MTPKAQRLVDLLLLAAALFGTAATAQQETAPRDSPAVAQLAWLSGCWERRRGSLVTEEQWMAPRGGVLLGASRTTRGDSLVEFEFMRIFARDGLLVFAAKPSGQQPAEFTAARIGHGVVTFENPSHDFPQRITYASVAGDSLHASISGMSRGEPRTVSFGYARINCPQRPTTP